MKMCWNSVLSKTSIFRISWWIVGPSTLRIQWTGALFCKLCSWGSSRQSGQLRCLQPPQHVVFNLGTPRPAMTACDFCAVHCFYSYFTVFSQLHIFEMTSLDLTWLDSTSWPGLAWLHWTWLDLTSFALASLHLICLGLTRLDWTCLDLIWLDLPWLALTWTSFDFCPAPFGALVAPATWVVSFGLW